MLTEFERLFCTAWVLSMELLLRGSVVYLQDALGQNHVEAHVLVDLTASKLKSNSNLNSKVEQKSLRYHPLDVPLERLGSTGLRGRVEGSPPTGPRRRGLSSSFDFAKGVGSEKRKFMIDEREGAGVSNMDTSV